MTAGGHGFDGVERRGLMFVLSSPSGAGKTTLSRLLIERMPGLKMSVSRDHAADAARRGRRPRLPVCRPIHIRGDGKAKRVARVGHRVRKSLWYAACAGRSGLVGGTGCAVRYRLAGHAAIAGKGTGGTLSAFSSCRRPPPIWKDACTPARRIPIGSSAGG